MVSKVSDLATRQSRGYEFPLWLNDRQVLVKSVPADEKPGTEPLTSALFAAPPSEKVEGSTVSVFVSPAVDKPPQERKPEGADSRKTDFAVLDVLSGATARIYRGGESYAYRLSPDKRFLAFLDREYGARATDSVHALKLLSLDSGTTEVVATGIRQTFAGTISWSPDSRRLAYASIDKQVQDQTQASGKETTLISEGADMFIMNIDGDRVPRRVAGAPNLFLSDYSAPLWAADSVLLYAIGQDNQVWKIDTGDMTSSRLTSDTERKKLILVSEASSNAIGSQDGGKTLLVTTRHRKTHRNGFLRVDTTTGEGSLLREEDKSYGNIFNPPYLSPDRRAIAFTAESSEHGEEAWIADGKFERARMLSELNPQLEKYRFGKSRVVDFQTADGKPLQAALVLPADYEPGKRYPLVLWVYASNADAARNVHKFGLVGFQSFNMHMLTTRGYAVMWPDIPTSEGTPVDDLMKAVMPAIDKVVDLGIVDPDRLAVMGNSNGGYSTLALITRTDRFKAAVMNAGFGDLTAFHGTMGGAWIPWLEQRGGSMKVPPWEAPQRYVENSPIYYLDRIKTPLIIQAGTADLSIVQHSDQVWVEMQRLSKPATYLRYGGEGHLLVGAANLQDYWGRVLKFYEKELAPAASRTAN
ncbi:S9 family peptidase [Pseudoxanthomonas yeongjuensis]|uniref:S9 family peptidase n=1 Tax=Pseudoxanthomonas yeongjuensis TaxID=377616 RepID=UPI001FE7EFE2|nr:prolyl oligopeptidase family serine peptidase [Pseudoxanthomonas yeongjuensis]